MIIDSKENNVLSSNGLGATQEFKIQSSAHAFKILSSGLYSDKVGAIIREIGSNAYDAHVAIGNKDKPFTVKLPNKIDSEFYIQDYGPGLSHEDVMGLYSTYFASTKRESNDFIGGFGLGSKSPFSYTDSFTVTSCHNGKKRIYTCYTNNKGIPDTSQIGEEETTDETGLKISFPVRPNEYNDFANKAKNIYKFFDPPPEIVGGEQIVKYEPYKEYDDFYVNKYAENNRVLGLLLGNVYYDIATTKLNLHQSEYWINEVRYLVLKEDIGNIQVSANRETIEYTPEVQQYIKRRITEIVERLLKEYAKAWDDPVIRKTWEGKCKVIYYIQDHAPSLMISSLRKLNAEKFQIKISDKDFCDSLDRIYTKKHKEYLFKDKKSLEDVRISTYSYNKLITRKDNATHSVHNIPYNKDLIIVHGAATYPLARVKEAINTGQLNKNIIVITGKSSKDPQIKKSVDNLVQELKDELGPDLKTLDVSTLNVPKAIIISKSPTLLPDITTLFTNSSYYVLASGGSNIKISNNKYIHRNTLNYYIKILHSIDSNIPDPVYINKRVYQELKIAKRKDVSDYIPFFKDKLKNIIDNLDKPNNPDNLVYVLKEHRFIAMVKNIIDRLSTNEKVYHELRKFIKEHKLETVIDKISNLKSNNNIRVDLQEPARTFDLKIKEPDELVIEDISKLYNAESFKILNTLDENFIYAVGSYLSTVLNTILKESKNVPVPVNS